MCGWDGAVAVVPAPPEPPPPPPHHHHGSPVMSLAFGARLGAAGSQGDRSSTEPAWPAPGTRCLPRDACRRVGRHGVVGYGHSRACSSALVPHRVQDLVKLSPDAQVPIHFMSHQVFVGVLRAAVTQAPALPCRSSAHARYRRGLGDPSGGPDRHIVGLGIHRFAIWGLCLWGAWGMSNTGVPPVHPFAQRSQPAPTPRWRWTWDVRDIRTSHGLVTESCSSSSSSSSSPVAWAGGPRRGGGWKICFWVLGAFLNPPFHSEHFECTPVWGVQSPFTIHHNRGGGDGGTWEKTFFAPVHGGQTNFLSAAGTPSCLFPGVPRRCGLGGPEAGGEGGSRGLAASRRLGAARRRLHSCSVVWAPTAQPDMTTGGPTAAVEVEGTARPCGPFVALAASPTRTAATPITAISNVLKLVTLCAASISCCFGCQVNTSFTPDLNCPDPDPDCTSKVGCFLMI